MILSVSASYQDAVSKYAWMKYTGSRGKEVSQRTHKRMIRDGDIFGILPLRNGGRYTLIFPDMPHVDFPLDKATGLFLMERASKLRKVPDVVNRDGKRTKVAGAQTMQRQLNRVQFDAARFSPRKVKSEAVYGVDFDNYQWRMVASSEYPVKTSKGMTKLYKNDMIGVRFLRPGKGGVVINTDGLFLKVDDAQYDLIVHDTNILPFNDWPKGTVDVDTLKNYRKLVRRARRRSQAEEEEAQRLANNAKVLEQKQQRKELQKEARKKAQERAAEMKDLRSKVRSGEIEAPKAEVRTVYEDNTDRRGKRMRVIEEEILDDAIEEVEIDLDLDEQKLEDILARSPFSGDVFNIEDSVGSLFGGDDSADHEEPALDLSDIDEPDDDEEDAPPPKVRAKGKKPAPQPEEEDTDGEEEVDPEEEEDPDAEEDTDDSDTGADDAEDGEDDSEDDGSVDDAESDDGTTDDEGEDGDSEDEDADAADAVDETSAEEDTDSDVAAAEKEARETAKKIAAANKSTPQHRAEEAEEGDVLQFRADAKLKRDWVVLKVSTHSASDNIVIYTVYDITNSPDEVRQVRVNRARKQNLFDYAEHVKDMAPKLFNRVLDMTEDFPVNKDPIAS
ncbi:hypothetical protein pEaSNUABM23_00150 [Erwinia phage pEa_SNUABM_23]|uniref:KTSC and Metallopeptidase-like N-terminal fusion domain-containing protein n=1 Tax=Erwinia phage pEa_SNUABM_3 TaxID=2869552 RepID=A0AAE7XL76_9CAUD|nr:hypothetical protein MPK68_gp151 [Erwinia phage pEa_SNUABM_3]QZE56348.1 hypothetical protein pEaSNUABM3_00151 [Erwinia phage pEa_SNUABM_3]QZE56687.1 hypothetical protein pEaSNUABM20_00151 [Erwinia phage pEa_SNUABM_20]UAW52932.1 hypothetical protein pEaSNUABM23_00150 [Erwinia phage pEa_SNUABM_23]UIW10828.1 hypothetical protein pEaSNUABM23_00150 [Erwinia phage pEa_SNUABM_31]